MAPQSSVMKQAARAKFASFGLRVPIHWRPPQGDDQSMLTQSMGMQSATAQGSPIGGQPLVLAASNIRPHLDVQKMNHASIGKFLDSISDGICAAWAQWQATATMSGIVINAVTASLGQVVGPPLAPLIVASGPNKTAQQLKFTNAVANTISNAWLAYTASIKVPGLPWYPAFGAFPGPMAPPVPNVPCPLMQLTQVTASLQPAVMKQQMVAALGDPNAPFAPQMFEAICDAFDKSFKQWQSTTMVTNVLGSGPVPTFAPPFVPVGPVVGGIGTMPPGGFVSASVPGPPLEPSGPEPGFEPAGPAPRREPSGPEPRREPSGPEPRREPSGPEPGREPSGPEPRREPYEPPPPYEPEN
jgi:hypothetical protein